jgi:hypothetical protein
LKYIVPFGKYYRGDIVIDHFVNSEEEDAETWVTDFCQWAIQEKLRDSWKLKFAMEAMNHIDVFWAKKRKAVGTCKNFLHLFRESFMGDCKYWAGTDPSVLVLSSFVGVACNVVNSTGSGYNIVGLLNKAEDILYPSLCDEPTSVKL